MSILHALILGIVQGLTEFLPISSSAHLIIFPELLRWSEQPLVFDTTLHLGTAAALLVFFRKDLLKYYLALIKDVLVKKFSIKEYSREAVFGFYLLLSTIPAGLLGILVGDTIEEKFRSMSGVIVTLIFGTLLMFVASKYFSKAQSTSLVSKMTAKKSLLIGSIQSLALFPGVSRSGSTISGGMFLGLSKEEAARFSFLASVPIVLMAGVFQLIKHPEQIHEFSIGIVLVGFLTSFVVGLGAIKFLLSYLNKNGLKIFIIYRIVLVVALLTLSAFAH